MPNPEKFNVVPPPHQPSPDTAQFLGNVAQQDPHTYQSTGEYDDVDGTGQWNMELPIARQYGEIMDAVDNNQVTYITAEMGAGKTTQVLQYLAEGGYFVICTQPRVVPARGVVEQITREAVQRRGSGYKNFIGLLTRNEKKLHPDNQIVVLTDGINPFRRKIDNPTGRQEVIVVDEAHESSENIERLLADARKQMRTNPNLKLVVMSGTIDADHDSKFFQDKGRREVSVIKVPGRSYPIEKHDRGEETAEVAIRLAREGKDTLVFVRHDDDIKWVSEQLEAAQIPGATIQPFHAKLSPEDQRKITEPVPGVRVVVSTNVGETGITIPGIKAVVDSGVALVKVVRNGVERMETQLVSQASHGQRGGRAGRTQAGESHLTQLKLRNGTRLAYKPLAEREAYSTPQIRLNALDNLVLGYAVDNEDAADIEFLHMPIPDEITGAKNRLYRLGALHEDGTVTATGKIMDKLPVETQRARMIVEGRKFMDDPQVRAQLTALVAVQEGGGILRRRSLDAEVVDGSKSPAGDDVYSENDSDLLKQLEVFINAQTVEPADRKNLGIVGKAYKDAERLMKQLQRAEGVQPQELTMPTPEQRKKLVQCVVAGMVNNVYISRGTSRRGERIYKDTKEIPQSIDKNTFIQPATLIVGAPYEMEIQKEYGKSVRFGLRDITNVPSVELLRTVAPHLYAEEPVAAGPDNLGRAVEVVAQHFNGQDIGRKRIVEGVVEEPGLPGQYNGTGYNLAAIRARYLAEHPELVQQ